MLSFVKLCLLSFVSFLQGRGSELPPCNTVHFADTGRPTGGSRKASSTILKCPCPCWWWLLANMWADLDFSLIEMNPFTIVNGEAYPLDMRGELDDTAQFKDFKK